MSKILDSSGNNIGIVESDGTVYSFSRDRKGRVLNGEVYNREGSLVGRYDSQGYIFRGTSKFGSVRQDGKVFDYNGHSKGKVYGENIEASGAALLLLFEES